MKQSLSLLLIAGLVLILTGCAEQVQPPLYNWGNYTKSSIKYAMGGHEKEVAEQHSQELLKIITESSNNGQRVAPGIYAEYGLVLFETNNKDKARKFFLLEKQTYPEASQFIDRVMLKLFGEIK